MANTGAMSTIPIAHTADADGAGSYTAGLSQSQDTNDSVMLHQLCDRCKSFIDSWELLKWAEEGKDACNAQIDRLELKFDRTGYKVRFATVEQLLQSADHCHLCAMVLSRVDRKSIYADPRISFRLGDFEEDDDESGGFLPLFVQDYDSLLTAHLYLRFYNVSSNEASEAAQQGRSVPAQPTANLDQIKTWLAACLQKHRSCSTWSSNLTTSFQRPTRLLELTSDGVRLRCDTGSIEGLQYLTLSHVWGDKNHRLRLTLSRLNEFQVAVPWSELPAMFVEALRIVQHLGFCYLWVDVLCIIQDSLSDWETEAAAMTSVYSNAICCISFLFPPGKDFIRTRKDPRTMSSCCIRKATQTQQGISIIPTTNRRLPGTKYPENRNRPSSGVSLDNDYTSRLRYHEWPIFKRAWTFQEHLLSPRTVFYGHETIMWECVEEFCDELAGSWLPQLEKEDYNKRRDKGRDMTQKRHIPLRDVPHDSALPIPFAGYEHLLNYFKNWKDLVWEYSTRNLTVSSDRPMAFAGVARAFQIDRNLTYLAGVWAESLPDGLLWFMNCTGELIMDGEDVPPSQTIREPGSIMAPSWSWFASPLYLDHDIKFFDDYQRRPRNAPGGPRNKLVFLAKLVHFQWYGLPLNQVPSTAFHDFSGLRITLEVATYEEARLTSEDGWNMDCPSLKERLESLYHVRFDAQVYCDYFKYYEQPPGKAILALLVETQRTYGEHSYFGGLALLPGEEEGTWKRFGYWDAEMYSLGYDDDDEEYGSNRYDPNGPSVFSGLEEVKMEKLTLV